MGEGGASFDDGSGSEAVQAAIIQAKARQYDTYVRMTEAITDRQAVITRFYTTLNTTLLGALAWVFFVLAKDGGLPQALVSAMALGLCLIGLILTGLWRRDHRTGGAWQRVKYRQIRQMEKDEPFLTELYAGEWDQSGMESLAERAYRGNAVAKLFHRLYLVGALFFVAILINAFFPAGAADLRDRWSAQSDRRSSLPRAGTNDAPAQRMTPNPTRPPLGGRVGIEIQRDERSVHHGDGELGAFLHPARPTRGDGLHPGPEAEAVGAVLVQVAEARGLPAAEGVIGQRHRDRRVDADHADIDPAGEIASRVAVAGVDGDAVAVAHASWEASSASS